MLEDIFKNLMNSFLSPEKRMFIPTLISTFILVLLIELVRVKSIKVFKKKLLNPNILFSQSSFVDLKLFFTNTVIKALFLPMLISTPSLASFLLSIFRVLFGDISVTTSRTTLLILGTIIPFIVSDFLRFFIHYLMHKVPILWKIHQVHHSATVLTPLTLHRSHPFEGLINSIRGIFSLSFSIALFIFLFKVPLNSFELWGTNILGLSFNFLFSNLRHTHYWLSFGIFEYVFVSPSQHQIHHSSDKKHFNKNMGVCLSLWDQLFGTFYKCSQFEKLSYGLNKDPSFKKSSSFMENIFLQFKNR